ncbi:olfactory receptor 6N1-like [Amia ocellicauda]|uniref:olfactory receptor 6N1-like n=1 Tax=Amia ocellicauda TaxID=2972642 RepID=UPI003463F791
MADANYTGSMVSEFIIVGFPGLQDRESKAILFAVFLTTYFYMALPSIERFNLLLMAYDRYVAICHPLHYPAKMTVKFTLQLLVVCWLGGFLSPILDFSVTLTKQFCGPNRVLQCFCDYAGVLRLACGDVLSISYFSLFVVLSLLLIPLFFIVLSYVKIIQSVLCISSSAGRAKAFSTCSSHLLVISVFFLTSAGVYISYRIPGTSVDMRVMGSVIQNVFPALMNPIIYCLRTKEIRDNLVKSLKRIQIFPVSK